MTLAGDSKDGWKMIQDGKRKGFAMSLAIALGTHYGGGGSTAGEANQGCRVRPLLAIAAVIDGASRTEPARVGGMNHQTYETDPVQCART
jgi:hypothetical protein